MILIKKILWTIWRIWFYALNFLTIIILSPLLALGLINDATYPLFMKTARVWALVLFYGMGFRYKLLKTTKIEPKQSYMIVANHTSMLDIMLMFILVKNPFVFVGKKELAKMPIFGFFYKRASILVDRASKKSRQETIVKAQEKLSKGLSVCIFPEGRVPVDKSIVLDDFKDGAFRLAIDFQIPILAISFDGLKKGFPFKFFSGRPLTVKVSIHPLINTKGLTIADKNNLKTDTWNLVRSGLTE